MIACLVLSKSLDGRQDFAFTFTIILSCEQLSSSALLLICLSENTIRINTETLYRRLHIRGYEAKSVCCHAEVSLTVLPPMIFHWQGLGCVLIVFSELIEQVVL